MKYKSKNLSKHHAFVTDQALEIPYKKKEYFFTKAERSFFEILKLALTDSNIHIFSKVRISDLLYIPKETKQRQAHWNRIQAKHIDFILVDQSNCKPVLAIELDDKTHQKEDRIKRDDFVDKAFDVAGLPLLRIPVQNGYVLDELKQKINDLKIK